MVVRARRSRGSICAVVAVLTVSACGDSARPAVPIDAASDAPRDATLASAKDLTAFAFPAAGNPGLLGDAMTVIAGDSVTATARFAPSSEALTATFSTTGARVTVGGIEQVSGVTVNDFTNPVRYRVSAEDGSVHDYTVRVTRPSFAPKVDVTTGQGPRSVAIADLNADGKPDLAVANGGNGRVSVLLNTTSAGATTPSFAASADVATGSSPAVVAIADFNADGKPDLAVTNAGSASVSVLLNKTGTGATLPAFQAKVELATGLFPTTVAVGDFNGDGTPDLAVASSGEESVSVLLNATATGATTPSFLAKVDFATDLSLLGAAVGDLNGDGKPDLATTNNESGAVLLNTTVTGSLTPSFSARVNYASGVNLDFVLIGDLDGDGKPDLSYAMRNPPSIVALVNTTDTAAATPSFGTAVGFATSSGFFALGDLDEDGKLDLVVAAVAVLLNTRGAAATPPSFSSPLLFSAGPSPSSVAIGDLNGDARPDLAVANSGSTTVSVFLAE